MEQVPFVCFFDSALFDVTNKAGVIAREGMVACCQELVKQGQTLIASTSYSYFSGLLDKIGYRGLFAKVQYSEEAGLPLVLLSPPSAMDKRGEFSSMPDMVLSPQNCLLVAMGWDASKIVASSLSGYMTLVPAWQGSSEHARQFGAAWIAETPESFVVQATRPFDIAPTACVWKAPAGPQ